MSTLRTALLLCASLAGCLLLAEPAAAQEEYLFWTTGTGVRRADLSGEQATSILRRRDPFAIGVAGSTIYWAGAFGVFRTSATSPHQVEKLGDTGNEPVGIAVDRENGHIYWGDADRQIRRIPLEGGAIDTVAQATASLHSIAFDEGESRLYWSQGTGRSGSIYRKDLSAGTETAVLNSIRPADEMELYQQTGDLYWINSASDTIRRVSPDTDQSEAVLTGAAGSVLTIDQQEGRLYWGRADSIWSSALDGSGRMLVYGHGELPHEILGADTLGAMAFDEEAGAVYWRDRAGSNQTAGNIWRYDLERSRLDTTLVGFRGTSHVVADSRSNRIYVTGGQGKILRAAHDGTELTQLAEVTCGIGSVGDIAVDTVQHNLYWSYDGDCPSYDLYRSDLSGNDIQILKESYEVLDLAVDADEGRIYWSDGRVNSVLRADRDVFETTEVDTVIEESVDGVALDSQQGHIYWTAGTSLYRMNEDGRDRTTLRSDLAEAGDIELDLTTGRIYGTPGAGNIWVTDLDGSDFSELPITGASDLAVMAGRTATNVARPADLPTRVRLAPNYPNPFNPSTRIAYELPRAMDVRLTVFDVLGRRIRTLVDRRQGPGWHEIQFIGSDLPSGLYFYQLQAGPVTRTRTMMFVK